jgi:hypothetical protein
MLNYCRDINALGVPVYRTEPLPAVRDQHQFPELDMAVHFGGNVWDGTPSRMFAHAIYEHDKGEPVEYIQSYGIDMKDPGHAPQQPYWAYWIAQARTRGIELGGTLGGIFSGPESDEGTRAIRDHINKALMADTDTQNKGGN